MAGAAVTAAVDLDDIQGLVRYGYRHLAAAVFLLLRVRDAAAARQWLAGCAPTDAQQRQPPPARALHVALSAPGLRALGVHEAIVQRFSREFVEGMAGSANRAHRLGDAGASHPGQWQWGGRDDDTPHVLVLLYASPDDLPAWEAQVMAGCGAGLALQARLPTSALDGREPFGFQDGLSQPEPDWQRARPVRDELNAPYGNLSCLGEYLLGYPNEYGEYTDRPLLPPSRDPEQLLPRAEDAPDTADLGRNGSYLVLRSLSQDVAGFWRHLDVQAGGDTQARERLAAAMVGRRLDGTPLAAPALPPGNNAFDYRADPHGHACPLGAHIRRSNPRNADLPGDGRGWLSRLVRTLGFDAPALAQDHVAAARFHRLLRRGRAWGQPPGMAQALAGEGGPGAGLHFICLNASIVRQFEFVQGAWLASTRFAGLRAESDPVLGPRLPGPEGSPGDQFSMPQASGCDLRLAGLPRFVEVLGGGYFFLPGRRALRYLASDAAMHG